MFFTFSETRLNGGFFIFDTVPYQQPVMSADFHL
jgi:hypothetical protein